MNIAFLFPGQGSQAPGMGQDLFEKYEEVKNIYEKVKKLTNIDIAQISFEGPEEKLNQTKYTQLAILTHSLAILEILNKNDIIAKECAGLSLGEYSALIYSGALELDEGIKLVQKRGEYMQELAPKGDWKMAAVLGLEDDIVAEVCEKATNGFVVPVNYNCKGQVVISGDNEGVTQAGEIAKEYGAKKVRVLNTSGPFHTEKLVESSKALRKELENVTFKKFNAKVIKNLDGTAYTEDDNIKDVLEKHIINPVRFRQSINIMIQDGIDTFIEIGPGKTLSGFVKRAETDREIKILNINNVQSLEETLNYIKENL